MRKVDVSVVIPCYNSEKSLAEVVQRVSEKLKEMNYTFEMILVNDYSKDNTFQEIRRLATEYSFVKGIDLAKNFGQHNAILAGFQYVEGDFVIGMDDDLQTDPSQFPKLFQKMEEGYDLVYGMYPQVRQNVFRKLGSRFNNLILGKMIKQPKNIRTSSFWLAKAYVVHEAAKYEHSYANVRGLFFRTTAYIASVEVEHFKRKYGQSNYTLKSLIKLWSSCINFSVAPLRIFFIIGTLSAAGGFLGALILVIRKLMDVTMSVGWPSLMTAVCFFSGLILIGIGVMGEYIGRAFMCINAAPQYVVRDIVNGNDQEEEHQ